MNQLHPNRAHALVQRTLVKGLLYTFIFQCLEVVVWPSTQRNDTSPNDNDMSSHSLRLFHHLVASFFLFPSVAVTVIVIPTVRTQGGLADISSSMDTDWPVVFTVGVFVTPHLSWLVLTERTDCRYLQIPEDCISRNTSEKNELWQKVWFWLI